MQYLIGILLLAAFMGMVVYSIKGGNLMLGILVMTILWFGLPWLGFQFITDPAFLKGNEDLAATTFLSGVTKVFQTAPENFGKTLITFIMGSWFGRVMIDTGIAAAIIRKTVELGGDKPVFAASLLYLVTAAIFTSMFGAGAVVAIGLIVLPILLSLGIPKLLALISYMLAVGAGFYINPVGFAQYQIYYIDAEGANTVFYDWSYLKWGVIALAIQLVFALGFTIVNYKKNQRVHAWAVEATPAQDESKRVPGLALLSPFIPVVLVIAFGAPIIPCFLLTGFFSMALCGQMKSYQNTIKFFSKTFYDGFVDIAPMVGISVLIPMLNSASSFCVPYFQALLGNVLPKSTLMACVVFAVIAPFGLFRGPLTLAGAGAATLGILKSLGFNNTFLFALMYAPTVTMNISSCITQSWIVWGLNYTNVDGRDFLKKTIPTGWIICIILAVVTFFVYGSM